MNCIHNSCIKDEIEAGVNIYELGNNSNRIYTSAVILPEKYSENKYLDIVKSSKLSDDEIENLANYIKLTAIDYSVNFIDINRSNILNGSINDIEIDKSIISMHNSLKNLKVVPENIVVFGNHFKMYKDINNIIISHQLINKENIYRNIEAAWILSKAAHIEYIKNNKNNYNSIIEVGIDEAGRGCLSGRVYSSAVILPDKFPDDIYLQIKDSKKLSKKKRSELRTYIENIALDYSIGYSEPDEIDKVNILQATINSMHRAIKQLKIVPDMILVDGCYFKDYIDNNRTIPHKLIKGGDNTYRNIAAASILAKVYHDEHVEELLKNNPDYHKYGWKTNMCYGTKEHMEAIKKYGITKEHRNSFAPCKL